MPEPRTAAAYPPMRLAPTARAGLMAMRVFLAVTAAMALYAFLCGVRGA
jgi:hypothetical protein